VRRAILAIALSMALPGGALAAAQEPILAIERLVAFAREALAAKQLIEANQYAEDAYHLAVAALEAGHLTDEPRMQRALAATIETRVSVMVQEGARAEAVRFLRLELDTNRSPPFQAQLQAVLDRVNLEGRTAPALATRMHIGPRVPRIDQLKGKVVLLFFWAHWCTQCRADGPIVENLLGKYRERGLTIVAPTRRYGYVEGGRPAAPARELRHIVQMRDTHYLFLRREAVPIGEANYREYGVTAIPMYVLVDRRGIVRLYRAGRMTSEELEAAIRQLL
jgi:thiol-disulfide isomerase/thioredoxin